MTPPPFVIFALPRSRTAWLAHWLGTVAQAPVAHDLAIEAASVDDWLESIFRRVRGTVETGSVEAWPILCRAIPECRIAVVLRPLHQVEASLIEAGLPVPRDDLGRRARALRGLAEASGVLALDYAALADPRVCARLQEHCLCQPFNWPIWRALEQEVIQLNLFSRMARLAERRPVIEQLKAELAERLAHPAPFVTVGEERWSDIAEPVTALAERHHGEATRGIEGRFSLDRAMLAQMADAGLWRCFVARVDGQIAGYCMWTLDRSLEADMPPTMDHGPLYAAPEHRAHQLGRRLLAVSRETFLREGIEVLRLHHTMHGRGVRAGRLYERLGAVEYQREYLWRIAGAT